MAKYEKHTKITTVKDKEGNVLEESVVERTKSLEKVGEPDYIKLYSSTWGSKFANEIPAAYLPLFLVLASRMCYCKSNDFPYSQLVNTGKPYSDELLRILGWKNRDSLQKGLKALCGCYAIRPVSRGVYQVNPSFAAKGQWKKNPRILWSDLEGFQKYFDEQIETIMKAEDGAEKGKDAQETSGDGAEQGEGAPASGSPEKESQGSASKKPAKNKKKTGKKETEEPLSPEDQGLMDGDLPFGNFSGESAEPETGGTAGSGEEKRTEEG